MCKNKVKLSHLYFEARTTTFRYIKVFIKQLTKDNKSYFRCKDVTAILKYKNTSITILLHIGEEDRFKYYEIRNRFFQPLKLGRRVFRGPIPQTNSTNYSGVYSVVNTSTSPVAKVFKKWLTSSALPSLHMSATVNPSTTTPLK